MSSEELALESFCSTSWNLQQFQNLSFLESPYLPGLFDADNRFHPSLKWDLLWDISRFIDSLKGCRNML